MAVAGSRRGSRRSSGGLKWGAHRGILSGEAEETAGERTAASAATCCERAGELCRPGRQVTLEAFVGAIVLLLEAEVEAIGSGGPELFRIGTVYGFAERAGMTSSEMEAASASSTMSHTPHSSSSRCQGYVEACGAADWGRDLHAWKTFAAGGPMWRRGLRSVMLGRVGIDFRCWVARDHKRFIDRMVQAFIVRRGFPKRLGSN